MINIREYELDDEKKIVALFNDVFKENREVDYWNWQFFKNPVKKPIIVLGEEDHEIVGQCTLLPTKIMLKNKETYVGQSIDTMIHKDYRGLGLHKKLAEKTYEIGKEENIKIRIGFPSQDALRGLLGGIGGSFVTDIPLYMKIYKLDSFIKPIVKIDFLAKALSILGMPLIKLIYRERKMKIGKDYEVKEIKEFNSDFDEFWNRIKGESPMMSIRDSKFLNWRIKEHPKIQYRTLAAYLDGEIKGYIIFKTEDRLVRGKAKLKLASLVDIVVEDPEVITFLYSEAKKYFKREKVDFVASWITDSMKYKDLLIQLGFKGSRSKIPFVVKSLDEDKELEEFINKEENWYLMPIESDFY